MDVLCTDSPLILQTVIFCTDQQDEGKEKIGMDSLLIYSGLT